MKKSRAYCVLNIKSFDDGEERIIEGIASTPAPDRSGDIVIPTGAKFALPMPLLWQHDPSKPVGTVEFAKPTDKGIPFKAKIAKISEVGVLKDRVDEAWQSVKSGLVRAVSIGFKSIDYDVKKDGGYIFKEWEWLELSLVTIPANSEATISVIKSYDEKARNASVGKGDQFIEKKGGVSSKIENFNLNKKGIKMNIAEQIKSFEFKRAANVSRLEAIMTKSAEEGRTLDDAESEEYDNLQAEIDQVDKHLVRLKQAEKSLASNAKAVENVKDAKSALHVRDGSIITLKSNLPAGTAFSRYVQALACAKGNVMQAAEIAKNNKNWAETTPQVETVLKAAVAAGSTTDPSWAKPLVEYSDMSGEIIRLLRAETILGKMSKVRNVQFNSSRPRQLTSSSASWVGEGAPKPVGKLSFDRVDLGHAKIAGIVVVSTELSRFSNPSAEAEVTQDLIAEISRLCDVSLIDPASAGVSGIKPASLTNGVTAVPASGSTADDLRNDLKALFRTFLTANQSLGTAALVMSSTQALGISLLTNALGQKEFDTINMNGGTLMGLPVIVSENVPTAVDGTSPIVLINQSDILLADDGQVMIDVSDQASLQMDSSPAAGPAELTSLWQNNLIGVRAERFINWTKARPTAVGYISGADYGTV